MHSIFELCLQFSKKLMHNTPQYAARHSFVCYFENNFEFGLLKLLVD